VVFLRRSPFSGSISLLFAAGPPVQIVVMSAASLVFVVFRPLEATIMGFRELRL